MHALYGDHLGQVSGALSNDDSSSAQPGTTGPSSSLVVSVPGRSRNGARTATQEAESVPGSDRRANQRVAIPSGTPLTCELVEEFFDLRSNEIAYRLIATNTGKVPINILSLSPRIPIGAILSEEADPLFADLKSRYSQLCSELSLLANRRLLSRSRALKDDEYKAQIDSVIAKSSTIMFARDHYPWLSPLWSTLEFCWAIFWRFVSNLKGLGFIGNFLNEYAASRSRTRSDLFAQSLSALQVRVQSLSEAQLAYKTWFEELDDQNTMKQLFEVKREQLSELQQRTGPDISRSSLATVAPGSFFAKTYVLKFPRNKLESRRYQLTVECGYSIGDQDHLKVTGVTKSLIISPSPASLTAVAVLGSMFGLLLAGYRFLTDWESIRAWPGTPAFTGVISAAILALVFFNVYEYTAFGKKFQMNLGWRSALLIGSMCGLMQDRILLALKALIG